MAIRFTVALCLALAVVSQAQDLTADLAAKENALNCLLGKPSCVSPSPPPTASSPPPTPTAMSPPPSPGANTPPPAASPPAPVPAPSANTPVPAPSSNTPVPAPATLVPAPAPVVSAPAPAPLAPAPAPTATAVVVLSLSLPAGYTLTSAQSQAIANIIAAFIPGTTVQLNAAGGRKMLAISSESIVITGIKDCEAAYMTYDTDVPSQLPAMAQAQNIPVQTASLGAYACSQAGAPTVSFTGTPAIAPGMGPSPMNAIRVLRKGNVALSEELRLGNLHSISPTTRSGNALLTQLQDECLNLSRKIDMEKVILNESHSCCKVLRDKIEIQRHSMGGLSAASSQITKANRSVKQQENRMQAALQSRNGALAATGELKARIEGLRRERLACREILHKAETVLKTDQTSMLDLLKESAAAAEQRSLVLGEVAAIQAKLVQVVAGNEAEWNQLSRIIQQDRQARENARQEDQEERERQTQLILKAKVGTLRRATAVGLGIARNRAAQTASATRMAQLTEDFAAVHAATGVEDPDALAEQMIAAEENKHHIFTFVAELNAELETMDVQVNSLGQELDQCSKTAALQQEKNFQKRQEWKELLSSANKEAETHEARAGRALLRVTSMREAIVGLFEAAGCKKPDANPHALKEGNAAMVMHHLGMVEQQVDLTLRELASGNPGPPVPILAAGPKARHRENSGPVLAAGHGLLYLEPPSIPPTLGVQQTAGLDSNLEPLLDFKVLLAKAEVSITKQLEDSTALRMGASTIQKQVKSTYR